MCYKGLAPESLLKIRFRCKAGHAEERAAFAPRLQLRHRSTAKSSKLQSPKNSPKKKLGEDRIRPSVYPPAQPFAPQHRKINCTLQNALAEKAAWWVAG